MSKKNILFSLSLILSFFLIGIVSATYCCEKTITGAWCQNMNDVSSCDVSFGKTAAFCEATSYCKLGTCVDSKKGTCLTSVSGTCRTNKGTWVDKKPSEIPQCKKGCCFLGDSAQFTTLTACNVLARDKGLLVNFQAAINDEQTCLDMSNPQSEGACVYTKDFEVNCSRTTKEKCNNEYKKNPTYSEVSFNEGILCSHSKLNTKCAMSKSTKCEGDDVYFIDTCGNLANVYDSDKISDENYWSNIQKPTCDLTKNPAGCGNCDYDAGTMCKEKKVGDAITPKNGNYICKSLDCNSYRGKYAPAGTNDGLATADKYPKHGESWCENDAVAGQEVNSPGVSYFKLSCYNGEVNTPELCGSAENPRNMICQENRTTKAAWCAHINLFGDCYKQTNQTLCEDDNVRDCKWISGLQWDGMGNYYFNPDNNYRLTKYEKKKIVKYTEVDSNGDGETETNSELIDDPNQDVVGICVPKYTPGYTKTTSDTSTICGLASTSCTVNLTKGVFGDAEDLDNWWCNDNDKKNNCSCYDNLKSDLANRDNADKGKSWANTVNQVCVLMGDCGTKTNAIGNWGYPKEDIKLLGT